MSLKPGRKLMSASSMVLLVTVVVGCMSTAHLSESRQPLVVLLTDFGEKDHYVGAMKGAIYSASPGARVESITNQISKFDVMEGAYTLAQAACEYPNGTIFVAVVDPGVGSSRNAIAIKARNGKIFIGPDNGLLKPAAEEAGIVEIRRISNGGLMRRGEISSTFHARDIFGPVAGHLAAGTPFEDVGPRFSHAVDLPRLEPAADNGRVIGHIVHVDDYGNVITNIPIRMVEAIGLTLGSRAGLTIGNEEFKAEYARTYSDVDVGNPLFLSNRGFVEAAMNRGNLARIMGAAPGMTITIERGTGPGALE